MPAGDDSIRAVLFDFGGVLLQHGDGIDHRAIEGRFGLAPGTVMRCLYQESRYADAYVGRCTRQEWLDSVREAITRAAGEQAPALLKAIEEAEHPLNQDVISLVRSLRPRYRTAVVSNTTDGLEPRLRHEFGIADLFDLLVGSGDLGIAKPEAAIYLHAAEKLGVPPPACVFIDDVQRHVDGALAVGMKGFRFVSMPQLLADLRSLGVRA